MPYPKKYVSYISKICKKTKRQIRLRVSHGVNWKQKDIQVEKVDSFLLLGKVFVYMKFVFPLDFRSSELIMLGVLFIVRSNMSNTISPSSVR